MEGAGFPAHKVASSGVRQDGHGGLRVVFGTDNRYCLPYTRHPSSVG